MLTLPPPNHRGPRLLLAGLLSVGIHATAIALAGVFPTSTPPTPVGQLENTNGDHSLVEVEPMGIEAIGPEFVPPVPSVVEEVPEPPAVAVVEEMPPPAAEFSDFAEPTPVPARNLPVRSTATPVRPAGPASLRTATPGTGLTPGNGTGPAAGGPGARTAWNTPKPPYPEIAKRMRQTGSGSMSIQTDASGRVVRAEMVQSITPALDATTTGFARAQWSGPPNRSAVVPVTFELR